MALPYTFSDLQADLKAIKQEPARSQFCHFGCLGKTLSGIDMDLITISDNPHQAATPDPQNIASDPVIGLEVDPTRRVVVFTARVHPGETLASYMMRGLLQGRTQRPNAAPEHRTLTRSTPTRPHRPQCSCSGGSRGLYHLRDSDAEPGDANLYPGSTP